MDSIKKFPSQKWFQLIFCIFIYIFNDDCLLIQKYEKCFPLNFHKNFKSFFFSSFFGKWTMMTDGVKMWIKNECHMNDICGFSFFFGLNKTKKKIFPLFFFLNSGSRFLLCWFYSVELDELLTLNIFLVFFSFIV